MPKTHTTLSIDSVLLDRAKNQNIVLSHIFEVALKQALGMTKKTDIRVLQLKEMQRHKLTELEIIKKELVTITNEKNKSKKKKKEDITWDEKQFQREKEFMLKPHITREVFNSVRQHRCKCLNSTLNHKLSLEEYVLKFEKFIKK